MQRRERDKPILLGATGGSVRHQLAIDHSLRAVFTYFGFLVVPTAIYATADDWLSGGTPSVELADRVQLAAAQAEALIAKRPVSVLR